MEQKQRRRYRDGRQQALQRGPNETSRDGHGRRLRYRRHRWLSGECRPHGLTRPAMHRLIGRVLVVRGRAVTEDRVEAGGVDGQGSHVTEDHEQAHPEEE